MCIIIGDPVDHSLSPAMHNAAYESLGIDDQFVYLGANVHVENVKKVVEAMRVMKIRGLTCTIPHKIEVLKYLDEIDEVAKKIGAVNTVVNENGKLTGYNTDWLGAVMPLEKNTSLKNKKVAIIGAGGASRAIVYGLVLKKAHVTIFNRTKEKAEKMSKEFNCRGTGLEDLRDLKNFDIIINSTSAGMKPQEKISLVDPKLITKDHVVFDIVYTPYETVLLKEAKKRGAKIVHGYQMLLYQGTAQFKLYTNKKAPEEVMEKILLDNLGVAS